jgi:hypothetical protein
MRRLRPHQAHIGCELSESLAPKFLQFQPKTLPLAELRVKTCHLNQAFRQYVDSGVLVNWLPGATPFQYYFFYIIN